MKKVWKLFSPYMVRPLIYQVFTRIVYTLLIILLLARFAGAPLSALLTAACLIYLLLAWVAWLRLDGARLPQWDHLLFRRKKFRKPPAYGDMADHLNDNPITFEELDTEERDAALLLSNLTVALICGIASFIV